MYLRWAIIAVTCRLTKLGARKWIRQGLGLPSDTR